MGLKKKVRIPQACFYLAKKKTVELSSDSTV